ncbi:penicillin-insensitive murein endopeptidase [Coralliovum pocilloporae]|uniref:penicillin-insensitive murein endopeptidase n=1 Tax=Coralliovum pocilloporae TaxID=3066369 RepID=UPI003307287B
MSAGNGRLISGLLGVVIWSALGVQGQATTIPAPLSRPYDVPEKTTPAHVPASKSNRTRDAAKTLFGHVNGPANLAARSIGSYARGCLAGGRALSVDGPHWQAMRLSRNRNWGHPAMIGFLEKLAGDAARLDGWPGLLVGDIAQPRGGPMLTGHRSHQLGLDADIWLRPMPAKRFSKAERETVSAISVLKKNTLKVDDRVWTEAHFRVLKRAAQGVGLARIFVHPGIKKKLCETETGSRDWLRKVRPWYGHHYHFHVRLSCPEGQAGCVNQAAPPAGDGCGAELSWWFSDEAWAPKPSKKPKKPRGPLKLADLPPSCTAVLDAAPLGQN